jgi:hypothetical protein
MRKTLFPVVAIVAVYTVIFSVALVWELVTSQPSPGVVTRTVTVRVPVPGPTVTVPGAYRYDSQDPFWNCWGDLGQRDALQPVLPVERAWLVFPARL